MGLIREIRSAFAHYISFRPDNEPGSCTLILVLVAYRFGPDFFLLSCSGIHWCNINISSGWMLRVEELGLETCGKRWANANNCVFSLWSYSRDTTANYSSFISLFWFSGALVHPSLPLSYCLYVAVFHIVEGIWMNSKEKESYGLSWDLRLYSG